LFHSQKESVRPYHLLSLNILENIPDSQRKACIQIAKLLKAAGGRALLVGGCVRDGLLGIPTKDVDIEVYGLSADDIERILKKKFRLGTVGRAFGVFIIKGHGIDLALPRRESRIGPKHTDFVVEGDPTMSPNEAAKRRDFTINAISIDPLTETILDPNDGLTDLKAHRLRHVSAAFSEDPLRVLRGMQFIARFDLVAAPETIALCRELTPEHLPSERLWEEWKKLILKGLHPSKGLRFLQTCNWLQYFPELEALVDCQQEPEWHPEGDVWTHTCHCLDAYARNRIGEEWEDLIVGLAVLCHDMGKPVSSFLCEKTGRIRSPRHDVDGVPIARTFLERLTRQKKVFEEVLPLVEQHMRPLALYRDGAGDSAIRRLAARVKRVDRLTRVAFADKCGRPPIIVDNFPEGEWLLKKAAELAIEDSAPKPLMLGRHLVEIGVKPSPQFGKILDRCYDAQLEGEFTDIESGRIYLKSIIET
jgi:tRNA nucleotidyltransferase (CCA-adding enzyme)